MQWKKCVWLSLSQQLCRWTACSCDRLFCSMNKCVHPKHDLLTKHYYSWYLSNITNVLCCLNLFHIRDVSETTDYFGINEHLFGLFAKSHTEVAWSPNDRSLLLPCFLSSSTMPVIQGQAWILSQQHSILWVELQTDNTTSVLNNNTSVILQATPFPFWCMMSPVTSPQGHPRMYSMWMT